MTAYGRPRQPGKIDPAALGVGLAGMIGWHSCFAADDVDTFGEGGAVTSWPNKGTAGGIAEQAASGNRPTWSGTSIAGQPGVTFDGSNDNLTQTLAGLNVTTISVVAILKLGTTSGSRVMVGLDGTGARYAPAVLAGAWYARMQGGGAGAAVSGGTPNTDPHLVHIVGKPSGTTLKLAVDNTTVASATASNLTPDIGATQTLYIGSDGASFYASMALAFLGIYTGDIEADVAWPTWKALAASTYDLTLA